MPACQIVIFAEYRDGGVCQRAMSLANHWWLWRCFLHGTHRWTQKPLTCSKFYLCCVRRVLHEHWTTMFILYTHVIQSYDYKTYFWLAAFFKVVVSSTCWVVPTMLQLVTRGDWWEASSGWKRGGCSLESLVSENIESRAPLLGGQFAAWGICFSSFDCTFAHIRGKEVQCIRDRKKWPSESS